MSIAPHPSAAILTRPCRGLQKTKKWIPLCPPLITLPSLILLFRARDMPPCTFPKFLEIWLQEPAPRARNATTACVQREACVCTHTRTHTPHGSPECPVIRLCFDLDTHREESTNDYTHTGGCSLYAGMYTKGIHSPVSPLIRPLTLVHTSHTRHTPQCLAVINLQKGVSGF